MNSGIPNNLIWPRAAADAAMDHDELLGPLLQEMIAGRFADQGQRQVDRYAGWQTALQRLRDDWANGDRRAVPELRDWLASVPGEHKSGALEDLIAGHLRLTWQIGCGANLEKYIQEFGQEFDRLASPAVVPAELVEDEFLARCQEPNGDAPSLEEYAFRFAGRHDVMQLLRGRCLDHGRYVKLQTRGQGAMGKVFEAFDRHLCRRVAIKVPKATRAATDELLGHFADEARVTAGLEHPGIVGVHEYFAADGATPFYVMRLVSGRTLGERIRDYHQPPRDRSSADQRLLRDCLLESFVAVCDAMSFAHARGVLHRDLKPGNIVVGEFGETVILDWGLGRRDCNNARLENPTAISSFPVSKNPAPLATLSGRGAGDEGLVVGTPHYMPPEQAAGVADVRSDVFGLGAILYEILTARPPHAWPEGFRPADWMRRVREAKLTPPRHVKPQTPRSLQAVCLKALARDPAERYQSAAELAREIRRYMAGVPIRSRAESVLVRAWRWVRGQ